MWNSNSIVAWLIVCSGVETASIRTPAGGRAPDWDAGIMVANRREPAAAAIVGEVPGT